MMKRLLLGATVVVLTGACGAYTFPGNSSSPTPDTGTVSGRVLVVPCAPVEKIGSPCAGRPAAGLEIDYVDGSTVVGRTVTDSAGNYSIRLLAGSYGVVFKNYIRLVSGPTRITISAGSNLVANYILDSGIRAPVPQD